MAYMNTKGGISAGTLWHMILNLNCAPNTEFIGRLHEFETARRRDSVQQASAVGASTKSALTISDAYMQASGRRLR